tara:strand:+ start:574 stop:738 length:165 start_codon:yes stop_codon:yes gene_type:complete
MEKVINKELLPKGDKLTIRVKKYKMTPKEKAIKELDKFLAKLRKKNGQSESIIS